MAKDFNFLPEDSDLTFIVVMISYGVNESMGIEPLGVYSSLETALSYATELESRTRETLPHLVEFTFDVLEYEMDKEPLMLGMLKKRREQMKKGLEDSVIKLMKKGIVDQLVGEDGNFYYTLTEEGEKKIDDLKLPKYIYELLKKKK
jgi:hypothetical protein